MAFLRNTLVACLIALSFFIKGQDSSRFNHEIGFNAVSLLQQVRIFTVSPGGQLPFDLFYNIYYKDKTGIRLGLGLSSVSTETEIDGQFEPRITKQQKMNLRVGVSHNFVNSKHFAFNFFADGVYLQNVTESVNSFTFQSFPNPVTTRTIRIAESSKGIGGQVGAGVKWKITKLLSLYTEMPLSFVNTITESRDEVDEDGMPPLTDNSTSKTTGIKIDLPLTLYLVLRF